MTSSSTPPPWAHKVSWERADVFRPATYGSLLRGADYVVHSMGILLEADYKGVLQGRENPFYGLKRAFSNEGRPGNPLERRVDGKDDIRPPESRKQLTYENMNRDTAIMLAKQAAKEKASAFAYISAAGGAPVLPTRYITTKREAESTIASGFPNMRGIFIRPPFLYDNSRFITVPMAAMTGLGAGFNRLTGGMFGGFLGAAGAKPLPVETVAQAVVEALEDESVRGPVEVGEIEKLAGESWRKNML